MPQKNSASSYSGDHTKSDDKKKIEREDKI